MSKSDVYTNANANSWINYSYDFVNFKYSMKFAHTVCDINIKNFKELWGKQNFCWTGYIRHWVWIKEFPTLTMFVLTSSEGTRYEIVEKENFNASHVLDALNGILNELENIIPNNAKAQ
jgi:hypothetical protein